MNQTTRSLSPAKLVFPLLLALIITAGAFLRFTDLSQPLLDFHPTRQLFSAVKARGMYYQTLPEAPAWQKDLSYRQWIGEATIEPPVVENLALFFYIRFGQENTAYPRAVSAIVWLIAAFFIFLLSRNLTASPAAATASLAFFLLLPYAVTASRAFQPDPLMVMLIVIFWWAIETWTRKSPDFRWSWAILAGLSGGLAIFIKLPAIFFIAGGALGAILANSSFPAAIKTPKTWLIALLCALPPAAYLYYGLYIDRYLGQQFGGRFYPELWISPYFYLRWFLKADLAVSILWIALALISVLVFAEKKTGTFLITLWFSYIIFGFTFAHHISSHDYYSLPLVPIVALSLAPLTAQLLSVVIPKINKSFITKLIVSFLLITALLFSTIGQLLARRDSKAAAQAALWAEIGNAVGHQPGVVGITTEYGYPLAYYGWQNIDPWPASVVIDDLNDVWARRTAKKSYFLVTDFNELKRQPELQQRLYQNYPILAQSYDYIIFDLLHPKQ